MPDYAVRLLHVPNDFPRLAELLNAYRSDSVTPAELAEAENRFPPGGARHRIVAVDGHDAVIGYAFARRLSIDKPGKFVVRAQVEAPWRGRGIGSVLLGEVEAFARENGATYIDSDVRDNDPCGLGWARRRGYDILDRVFESVLQVDAFDEAPFAGLFERLEAEGIRFATLDQLDPGTREQKLYALDTAASPDNPLYDLAKPPSFDLWHTWVLDRPNMPPGQILIALDGERFVGEASLERNAENGSFYHDFTAVAREYRGRGIALALKLMGIRLAKHAGAPFLRTNNHSENAPMLAINRKLGYVPVPGFYGLRKPLP